MSVKIKKHIDLLGLKVQDKVTNLKGIVSSMSFDLYGCVQALIQQIELDKDGQMRTQYWVDVNRLKVLSKKPVMETPNFEYGIQAEGKQGCVDKPIK